MENTVKDLIEISIPETSHTAIQKTPCFPFQSDHIQHSLGCSPCTSSPKYKLYGYEGFLSPSSIEAWQEINSYSLVLNGVPTLRQLLTLDKGLFTLAQFEVFLSHFDKAGLHHLKFLLELETHFWLYHTLHAIDVPPKESPRNFYWQSKPRVLGCPSTDTLPLLGYPGHPINQHTIIQNAKRILRKYCRQNSLIRISSETVSTLYHARILLVVGLILMWAGFSFELTMIFLGVNSTDNSRWWGLLPFVLAWVALMSSVTRFGWWMTVFRRRLAFVSMSVYG
ncbi:hypothetical protein BDF14DRAFT_1417936 [Spinellus fusiger]|nr:hypothetical protein BDF14DRAFT_1417936 [Spinellus fusiger]